MTDLSDWVCLLRARGFISCRLVFSDLTVADFDVFDAERSVKNPADLLGLIRTYFQDLEANQIRETRPSFMGLVLSVDQLQNLEFSLLAQAESLGA